MSDKVDYLEYEHDAYAESLVNILCTKTQNDATHFYRLNVAYNFCKIASMMRVSIKTHDRGLIPVNMYALNLATSGFGKGHSTNIIEEEFMEGFKEAFTEVILPVQAELNLVKLAAKRAVRNGTDDTEELEALKAEFLACGDIPFAFDGGSTPALKQIRHATVLAGAGSLNLEVDEIGTNLTNVSEILGAYLEMFDVGKIKSKITKNTSDSKRASEIPARVPANCMLYGTPAKLFDGGLTEKEIEKHLETGYARRCFFGLSTSAKNLDNLTGEILYERLTKVSNNSDTSAIYDYLANLADQSLFGTTLEMTREVNIALLDYKLDCERKALKLGEYQSIEKAELMHRYFKALKVAGAYAFVNGHAVVEMEHLKSGIRLAEDSGIHFKQIMKRERAYIRLAKYLIQRGEEVTHPEIVEDLPFYPNSAGQRAELINMATAWAYNQASIIRRRFQDNIEFIRGQALAITDLSSIIVSYSDHPAEGYEPVRIPFLLTDPDDPTEMAVESLISQSDMNYVNHFLIDKYRHQSNVVEGFNMIVLDVDGTARIEEVTTLLAPFTYMIYTTKSHTEDEHCFRILLPTSHVLELERSAFITFMENLIETLPFKVDESTRQPERKWACNPNTEIYVNDNENQVLFDVMPYIPETSRDEKRKKDLAKQSNMNSLERWFINNTGEGNRNNQLFKYGVMLLDMNWSLSEASTAVSDLNNKLADKLTATELAGTVLKSLTSKAKKMGLA